MRHQECPTCLTLKRVWNGVDYITCPTCRGVGLVVQEEDEEELLLDEDIFEEFNEEKHSRPEDSINTDL